MKSELLRKALMSKMVNGGNVGDGGKKDDKKKQQAAAKSALTGTASGAPIDDVNKAVSFFTEKQMSPQEWATYAEKQGWKPFHAESEIPVDQQIKMNKYIQYYDPKQYSRTETGYVKLGDIGKNVDYSRDTTYKPNIQYGLTKPTTSAPPAQTATQDSLKFQFLPRIKLYGSQKEQYDLFKSDPETYKKRIEEYSKLRSEWEKQNPGHSGGMSGTPRYIKGYTEPKTSTADPLQAKKSGGIVGKYAFGGDMLSKRDKVKLKRGLKQAGATAYGVGEGFLDTVTMGATDQLTDQGYYALQELGNSTESQKREQDSLRGYGSAAGSVGGAIVNPAATGTAISQAGKGLGQGVSKGSEGEKWAQPAGTLFNVAGQIGSIGYGMKSGNMSEAQQLRQKKYDTSKFGKKSNQVFGNEYNTEEFAKGGTIKGAGTGTSDSIVTDINKKGIPEGSFITPAKNNEMAKGIRGMVLGDNPNKVAEFKKGGTPKSDKVAVSNGEHLFTPAEKEKIIKYLGKEILEKLAPEAEDNEMEKKKGGEMIKRADGSYSKRGLWDNIRANIGSGKKPTPEMLKQEKEIIAEKENGGDIAPADKTMVKSPNISLEALRKFKEDQKLKEERGKKYDKEMSKGNTIVAIPNKPTIESKKFKSADSTYFYPNAYVSQTEGGKKITTKLGAKYKEKDLTNPKDVYIQNPNAVIRQSPDEYKELGYAKGGYVVKRSSERKGKTHVVTGPDGTKKYFGDSNLGQHPNDPARKKAFYARHEKNLKKNPYFRAFARETWAEGGTVGSKMNKAKGGELTKSKAKEILHDKSVHGKPLTDKQRKYMGWVAGGKKNMGGIVGKYAMGGNVNRDWDWG